MFLDVQNVDPGVALPEKIRRTVKSSQAVIAAIGDGWATRLNDPDDYVRLELATALENRIAILPVLLDRKSVV